MADQHDRPLVESDLDRDPVALLRRWLEEARASGVDMPEAMTLATATRDGAPSARMVLLKDVGPSGLTFYTGYESRKGDELAENPRAAIVLYWRELGRQIRVEGVVERLDAEESDAYFGSRPLASRLSAAVSPQSRVIASRDELERAVAELGAQHSESVPRPETWGGYRITPTEWEFWQHRDDRLHDRFRYRPDGADWNVERLAP